MNCCEELKEIEERRERMETMVEGLHQMLTALLKERNRKLIEERESPPSPDEPAMPEISVEKEEIIKILLSIPGKRIQPIELEQRPSLRIFSKEIVEEAVDELVRDGLLRMEDQALLKTSPELLSPEELLPYALPWKDYVTAYYSL